MTAHNLTDADCAAIGRASIDPARVLAPYPLIRQYLDRREDGAQ